MAIIRKAANKTRVIVMNDKLRGILAVIFWWPVLLVLIWLAMVIVAIVGMPENDYTGSD